MIAITRSKYGIRISDIFFADDVKKHETSSPFCFFVQAARKHPLLTPFQTSVIDLTAPLDEISAPISKNTRYKINRAEREGFIPHLNMKPTDSDASIYATFYNTFASQKGLPPCNNAKLRSLCSTSGLLLSSVSDPNGALVAAHAYVKDLSVGRVRLLYSASHFRDLTDSSDRNKVGRANRLLHWHEILSLKELGFRLYDLGGLPIDSSDQAKNDIARFKLEFGGTRRIEYTGILPTTTLARFALFITRGRL